MTWDLARRRLKVRNCYSFRIGWVGWGARVSICSLDILRRKLFYIRGKPWPPFYLRSIFIHCVGNSFMLLQSAKFRAFIRPHQTQENHLFKEKKISLNSELQVVDLVSSLFFLWKNTYSFFSACNCVQHVFSLLLKKSYRKHYIVTF